MSLDKFKNSILGLRPLVGVLVFLAIWEIAPRIGMADPVVLPPFSIVMAAWFKLLLSGALIKHLLVSLGRSIVGFSLGLVIAVPLGFLIGWFKSVEYYLDGILQTFRQTPVLALFPVFILIFGIGEVSKVSIIFWGVQWAILLNTITGVKNVDPLLIKSARSMGASPLTLFSKVVFPSAVPNILTGIRLSATTSVLIIVAVEMMGASSGLGFLVFDSEIKFKIPNMYAAIITLSMLGLILNYSIVYLEKRVTHWKEELRGGG